MENVCPGHKLPCHLVPSQISIECSSWLTITGSLAGIERLRLRHQLVLVFWWMAMLEAILSWVPFDYVLGSSL